MSSPGIQNGLTDMHGFTRPGSVSLLVIASASMWLVPQARAQGNTPSEVTLFKNVNVFNGTHLINGYDVLVVGNKIEKVAQDIPTTGT
jgi:hypothetical protein